MEDSDDPVKEEKQTMFHEMGLDDRILEAIARQKWEEPTPIQEKAIPLFLQGKDILARARTGSGKTGAYLIPLIHKILERKPTLTRSETSALILGPTKELCNQIAEHVKKLTILCQREVRCIDISQQIPMEAQKTLLADNPDIVIGTPLKVLSHLNEGRSNFMKTIQYVIIDEADLMFAFEHEKDMKNVLKKTPSICQSFITSATLADDVKELKNIFLHNPVVLKLEEPPLPPESQLTQYVVKVEELDKIILVYALVRMKLIRGKTLLFVNTVDKSYKIKMFLGMFGITSCVLNSELPVASRCHVVHEFNRGKYTILIASDEVAVKAPETDKQINPRKKRKRDAESGVSRGIDFQLVSNVVNFDFPPTSTAYMHRVGRTARGSMEGTALSLVSSHELPQFEKIEKELKNVMGYSGSHDTETIFKDYKFNMTSLDGFRYRAMDVWKQCSSLAVKKCRKKELRAEILNSQKLKSFFDDHPTDLEVLRHDLRPKTVNVQPHLRNVPEYNVPAALKRVAVTKKRREFKLKPGKTSKDRFLKKKRNPLKSFSFPGPSK